MQITLVKMYAKHYHSGMLLQDVTQHRNSLDAGKKSGRKTWTALPQLTNVFIRLSNLVEITDKDKVQIERFVCVMYDRGSKFSSVNSARRFLFTTMSRTIENCPPTAAALEQHIKWSQLQAA